MPIEQTKFSCPRCGQVMVGTKEHVGTLVACPTCQLEFDVQQPSLFTVVPASRKQSQPFFAAVLAVFVLVFAIGYTAFRLGQHSPSPTQTPSEAAPLLPPKPATSSSTQTATSSPTPVGYENFLREAQRTISLIESGVDYPTFRERILAVAAVRREALDSIDNSEIRQSINDFTQALQDVEPLWRYMLNNNQDRIMFHMEEGHLRPRDHPVGGRWDVQVRELAQKYGFHEGDKEAMNDLSTFAIVRIEAAIQNIFGYATARYEMLAASR